MAAIWAGLMMPFGAVAVITGVVPMTDAVSTVWCASSLIEVPATIKAVQLDRRYRSSNQSLSTCSRYVWQDVTYDSCRISVQHWPGWRDGASWHQEWFDRLDRA